MKDKIPLNEIKSFYKIVKVGKVGGNSIFSITISRNTKIANVWDLDTGDEIYEYSDLKMSLVIGEGYHHRFFLSEL